MRLPQLEYLEPKTLKKVVKAFASDTKGSVLIAGGTDLLVNMKHRVIKPNADLHRLPCLQTEDGWNSFEESIGEFQVLSSEFRVRSIFMSPNSELITPN